MRDSVMTYLPFTVLCLMLSQIECQALNNILDVRLVNGTSHREGIIQYTEDNVTWSTICGTHLDFEEVMVICRQLGFSGANRAIPESPFETNFQSIILPVRDFGCVGTETTLSDCSVTNTGADQCVMAGAANCYDGNYLGCFVDRYNDSVLPDLCNGMHADPMLTIDRCITCCNNQSNEDYVYVGVEFGNKCYCGTSDANYCRHGLESDAACSQSVCSGKNTESCGGFVSIALFNISSHTTPDCTAVQPSTITPTSGSSTQHPGSTTCGSSTQHPGSTTSGSITQHPGDTTSRPNTQRPGITTSENNTTNATINSPVQQDTTENYIMASSSEEIPLFAANTLWYTVSFGILAFVFLLCIVTMTATIVRPWIKLKITARNTERILQSEQNPTPLTNEETYEELHRDSSLPHRYSDLIIGPLRINDDN